MSPQLEKKRKTAATTTFHSIPHNVVLSIFARVPSLYYPTLSLVSKSFRPLLVSPELYKARSLLGHTESCLYLCFECHSDYHWFTLCRKPDQTLIDDVRYVLARVPVSNSPPANFSSLVTVGSDIYNIAGSIDEAPSSSVSILDCRSHTWREAPSLRVELTSVSASVLDRKIYVVGRYPDEESDSREDFFEAFDTETHIWDPQPGNCSEAKGKFLYGKTLKCASFCIDGKFHVMPWAENEVAAYNSKEGRWELAEPLMRHSLSKQSYCQVDNVLYSASRGMISWYDTKLVCWRSLMGLRGPHIFLNGASLVRLADYRGKMAVFWVNDSGDKKMIWCAVIALERLPRDYEIWGNVESFDHVLTVPREYNLVKALAATV